MNKKTLTGKLKNLNSLKNIKTPDPKKLKNLDLEQLKNIKLKENLKTLWHNDVVRATLKIVVIVIIAISLLMNLFTLVIPAVKYYGTSMAPTFEDEQVLIVNKLAKIENGDIIAFYYNDKVLIRRVVASGNQQINIDIFGTVKVNGQELEEPYAQNKTLGQCNLNFPYNIPSNSYFVMGDNRDTSMDSRLEEIGPVSKERVIGKVVFSVSPLSRVK